MLSVWLVGLDPARNSDFPIYSECHYTLSRQDRK